MNSQTVLLIGLGKMGTGVGHRLSKVGKVHGYDSSAAARDEAARKGITPYETLKALSSSADGPRIFWIMVPAGEAVDTLLNDPSMNLKSGDIVIDAGNSHFKDSTRRSETLAANGVHFLDMGTSGGIWGETNGFCLMVGGNKEAFASVESALKAVAAPGALLYVGPSGSGHYVKMVHNAIEYGMLQVLGEGFWLLKSADQPLELEKIAHLWNQGSVVRSWLLELTEKALADRNFDRLSDEIGGGQTGHWAVTEALTRRIPTPLIGAALMERFESSHDENFSHKLIAALRQQFGGHEVKQK